jgi:hypothetical protein
VPGRLLPAFDIAILTWRAVDEWGALVLTVSVPVLPALHRRGLDQMIAGVARPPRPQSAAPSAGRA